MDGYTVIHHLSLVVCLLVLPLFPLKKSSVDINSEDVEDLVLTGVGHIPLQGLYVCFTRPDGAAPDLSLQYTVTYTHGHRSTLSSCNGDLSYRGPELKLTGFCLPPCPEVEGDYLLRPVSLVVTGHDRTTREAIAALLESVTFLDVAPTLVQVGNGVLEVQWTGRPGGKFRVQLWHAANDESRLNEGEAETRRAETKDETLAKIRQCYHESDYYDDDDDDDNDDDDDEEDNDDFIKWKRWRRCVALHAPRAPGHPVAATPSMVHTSQPLSCLTDTCLYYITDAPASGNCSVVVMDVTQSPVHASHSAPMPMQEWTVFPVESVTITSAFEETNQLPKTMTITVVDESSETGEVRSGQAPEGTEAATAERDGLARDMQAVVINGGNHSQALRTLLGECSPTELLGAKRIVCTVRGLQTLEDPQGLGPVSNLLLLLTNHNSTTSSLVAITDVHVRVKQVGQGVVLVMWDKDITVQQFTVDVTPEAQSTSNRVHVACDKKGTDCLAIFQDLMPGRYTATVSYERQTLVRLQVPFVIEEGSQHQDETEETSQEGEKTEL